jgi:hypothetical protein
MADAPDFGGKFCFRKEDYPVIKESDLLLRLIHQRLTVKTIPLTGYSLAFYLFGLFGKGLSD